MSAGSPAQLRPGGGEVLILSGSIGQGHATVAEVCKDALEESRDGPPRAHVSVCDCIELLGPVESFIARRLYRTAIAIPSLYDGFHFAHLRAEGRLASRGDSVSSRRIIKSLEGLGLIDSLTLVLAVFASGAPVASQLALRRPGLRTAVFCTDATAHAKWIGEKIDLYLTTCELAARSVRRYRPDAEVTIVPPPVRPAFFEALPQDEARLLFGIPPDATCVLLVGGGWGLGPVAASASSLAREGFHVLAVSGSNERLNRTLERLARDTPRIRPLGFCRDMPNAIAAADVVVSAAGQTCNEVHAVGRRLVVLDAVPGHGRENSLYEVARRGATAVSPTPESVVKGVSVALKEHDAGDPWPVRSAEEWRGAFVRALEPLQAL